MVCVPQCSHVPLVPSRDALSGLFALPAASILGKRFHHLSSKQHVALNSVGFALSAVGSYAIYTSKEAWGKPHLASYHAWAGAAALAWFSLGALGVSLSLWTPFAVGFLLACA